MRGPSTRRNPGETRSPSSLKLDPPRARLEVMLVTLVRPAAASSAAPVKLVEGGVHHRDVGHDVGHQALAWTLA